MIGILARHCTFFVFQTKTVSQNKTRIVLWFCLAVSRQSFVHQLSYCGSPILRTGNHLVLTSPKQIRSHFCPKTKKIFWKFFFLANLDSASKVESWFHPPLPTHPPSTWEFWILVNLNSASNFHEPPPPPSTWEFWILAHLNSASNFHECPPPPPSTWEFWILANLNSASNFHECPPPASTSRRCPLWCLWLLLQWSWYCNMCNKMCIM